MYTRVVIPRFVFKNFGKILKRFYLWEMMGQTGPMNEYLRQDLQD